MAGFRLYGEPTPSAGIDFTSPLSDLTAYPAGMFTDGFGLGGFGAGGLGQAASAYSWTSDPLAAGSWQLAVVPYDEAGNEGPTQPVTAAISAPPRARRRSRGPCRDSSTTCSPSDRFRSANGDSACHRRPSPGTHPPSRRRTAMRWCKVPEITPESCTDLHQLTRHGSWRLFLIAYRLWPTMSNTYTSNIKLAMPAIGDTGWSIPVNANCTTLDGFTAIGALAVSTRRSAECLPERRGRFRLLSPAGRHDRHVCRGGVAGDQRLLHAGPYLDLTASGTLVVAANYPTTPHVRLATVVGGNSTIGSITDNRQCFNVVGSSADNANITLGTAIGTQIGTASNQKLGFFGKTPTTQPTMGAATAGYRVHE